MDKEFLYDMLRTPSVSGHEIAVQKKVIQHMEPVADEILTDATGDVISVVNPHAEAKVLLCGHIDEIGFLVTRICEDGMLKVTKQAVSIRFCIWGRMYRLCALLKSCPVSL